MWLKKMVEMRAEATNMRNDGSVGTIAVASTFQSTFTQIRSLYIRAVWVLYRCNASM